MLPTSEASPLSPIITLWLHALETARKHKWNEFGLTARECMHFFDGSVKDAYGHSGAKYGMDVSDGSLPEVKVVLNKVAELVRIFGPVMYSRNPNRQVNATTPEMPELLLMMDQQGILNQQVMNEKMYDRAGSELLAWVLNYTAREFSLKEHSRIGIDEALIKGRGLAWTEIYTPPESEIVLARSVFDSVDNLLVDPDATSLNDAMWIARRREQPYWLVERKFGLDSGSLKGVAKGESLGQQIVVEHSDDGDHYRRMGQTSDMVTYWEIYSKTGAGNRLNGGTDVNNMIRSRAGQFSEVLEEFGDNVYLAIVEGLGYPLNLSNELLDLDMEVPENEELIKQRMRWQIPYWKDGSWPVTELDFHVIPGRQWPQSHMKPGLAELKLMNWIMSFLAGRIKWTSRMMLVYAEHLDEEIKEQLESGSDLALIPNKQHLNNKIKEQIEFIEFPPAQKDLWDIWLLVSREFEKRTGLNELMYGISGRQDRSATESQLKGERVNIQPDDMAARTEDWQSRIARKEALATRWFTGPESFAPIVGEQYSPETMQVGPRVNLWNQLVYVPLDYSNPDSLEKVVREYDYSIEAGSIRKPNRDRDQSNMNMAMQSMFGPYMQVYMTSGNPQQVNWLITQWAKAHDFDISSGLFQPIQIQPQPQQGVA